MARKKKEIPKYGTVVLKGVEYYRTRIEDADGRRVALYARTPEELLEKVEEAQRQIEDAVFRRTTPTVAEYCERWLTMQSARIRPTTLIDYTSKVKNYIILVLLLVNVFLLGIVLTNALQERRASDKGQQIKKYNKKIVP